MPYLLWRPPVMIWHIWARVFRPEYSGLSIQGPGKTFGTANVVPRSMEIASPGADREHGITTYIVLLPAILSSWR